MTIAALLRLLDEELPHVPRLPAPQLARRHFSAKETHPVSREVRLTCTSPEAAAAVIDEHADYFGAGPANTVRQDGNHVVIAYFDKRWPIDVAEWAHEQGHAHDDDASAVITAVQQDAPEVTR